MPDETDSPERQDDMSGGHIPGGKVPSVHQDQRRQRNFTYHAPGNSQIQRMQAIRTKAHDLSHLLDRCCTESRELSLAQTKIEEAVMWANAGIARTEAVADESNQASSQ